MNQEAVLKMALRRLNTASDLVRTELNIKQIEHSGVCIQNIGPYTPRLPLILLFVEPNGDGTNEKQAKKLVNICKQNRYEIYAGEEKYAWIPLSLSTREKIIYKGIGSTNETTAMVFIDYSKIDFVHSISTELLNAFFQSHYIFSEIWIIFDGTSNVKLPINVTKNFHTIKDMLPFLAQRVACNAQENNVTYTER